MTINTIFPGRPKYKGPKKGIFGFVHHEVLWETSHNIDERIAYVKANKPKNEIAIRLYNMIYLGKCSAVAKCASLDADYRAKRAPLDADYEAKRASLDADYEAKCASLDADYEAKCASLYTDYRAKCASLYTDYRAKCTPLDADYRAKCASLDADYRAKCAPLDAVILAYIKKKIPDCVWNGKTLVF